MGILAGMKLDQKKQISYRSTEDIVSKLDLAAARLAAVKVAFAGSKLRTGHLVNAIALWVGEMPTDELEKFARPKLAALETYLGRSEDEVEKPADPSADCDEPKGVRSKPASRASTVLVLGAKPDPDESIDALTNHALEVRAGRVIKPSRKDLAALAKHGRPPRKG
jgi:hypothetical protein